MSFNFNLILFKVRAESFDDHQIEFGPLQVVRLGEKRLPRAAVRVQANRVFRCRLDGLAKFANDPHQVMIGWSDVVVHRHLRFEANLKLELDLLNAHRN